MKKIIFVVLMLFGFNAIAEMNDEQPSMDSDMDMNQMSDMVADYSGDTKEVKEESGFVGSFSLRYQPLGELAGADDVSYRARVGWKGDVNDQVKWGVVLSTNTEQGFSSLSLQNVSFEKAYVSYSPVENLYVKVGKMGWTPDFHKVGALYSEQVYQEGAKVKYKHEIGDNSSVFAKVGAYRLTGNKNAPLQDGTTFEGKLGAKFSVGNFDSKVYAKGAYDGFFQEEAKATVVGDEGEEAKEESVASADAKTLVQAGLMVGNSDLAVPAGVFAHYLSDVEDLGDFSYSAGFSVGSAGKANSTEAGDFGLAVSYYVVKGADYRQAFLNEDYLAGAGNGVAARVQYNVWDQSSVVLKYAFDMSEDKAKDDDGHNLVAELTFAF